MKTLIFFSTYYCLLKMSLKFWSPQETTNGASLNTAPVKVLGQLEQQSTFDKSVHSESAAVLPMSKVLAHKGELQKWRCLQLLRWEPHIQQMFISQEDINYRKTNTNRKYANCFGNMVLNILDVPSCRTARRKFKSQFKRTCPIKKQEDNTRQPTVSPKPTKFKSRCSLKTYEPR